jgi:hypothetical protein
MEKEYNIKILEKLMKKLEICDRIMLLIFKKYTYRILKIGIEIGFNWEDKEYECQPKNKKINDLSTEYK